MSQPYGHHNAVLDAVAADLGYQIVGTAYQSFSPQNIVIGHLNHPPVTRVYGQLVEIITARRLRTVTLNDVFLRPPSPRHLSRADHQSPWPPW